jgi:hypothetical protein
MLDSSTIMRANTNPPRKSTKETTMTSNPSRRSVQTFKNRCTLLAALVLTIAACYLLVGPPV